MSIVLMALESLMRGALGYAAQLALRSARRRWKKLEDKHLPPEQRVPGRRMPPSRHADEEIEELLSFFCQQYGDIEDLSPQELTIRQSIEVIGSRANTTVALCRVTVIKLVSKDQQGAG